jgi:hypothetical protein
MVEASFRKYTKNYDKILKQWIILWRIWYKSFLLFRLKVLSSTRPAKNLPLLTFLNPIGLPNPYRWCVAVDKFNGFEPPVIKGWQCLLFFRS